MPEVGEIRRYRKAFNRQGKRHQRELEAVGGWLREREGWSIRKLVKGLKEEKGIEVSTATVWRWWKKEL